MARIWRLWATIGVVAIVALGVVVAIAVRGNREDTAVSDTPGSGPPAATDSLLHAARLDLADRLKIEPTAVTLTSIRPAGFDGCLGVYLPDQACTEQFIGGYIALFEAEGKEYRYHFGGRFVATDFQPAGARIDNGLEVPAELNPDLVSVLAEYARHDAKLEAGAAPGEAIVEALLPYTCPPNADCPKQEGVARIGLAGETVLYELTPEGDVPLRVVDELPGWAEAQAGMAELQQRLREDLAGRLHIDVGDVSVRVFRLVTWPDGCMGVLEPDKMCTQAIVDGWLAKLTAGDKVYNYHGEGDGAADSEFLAASFVENATVFDGMPRQQ